LGSVKPVAGNAKSGDFHLSDSVFLSRTRIVINSFSAGAISIDFIEGLEADLHLSPQAEGV